MSDAALLEVRELSISFGALTAVSGLSFSAARGCITSVIGPNGAGKSTLFNLVSGALRPQHGRVAFAGADVTGWSTPRLLKAGLARSFQITNLFFELSVYENLRLAAQVLEPGLHAVLPTARSTLARDRAEELVERFGLAEKATGLAGHLSHGEQRRLEIAVALACRPRLLLLDEPAAGLRLKEKEGLAQVLRQLRGEGMSILLVEHDMDLVMGLVDRIVVMEFGTKLIEGTPEEVQASPAVRAAYLGTEH